MSATTKEQVEAFALGSKANHPLYGDGKIVGEIQKQIRRHAGKFVDAGWFNWYATVEFADRCRNVRLSEMKPL